MMFENRRALLGKGHCTSASCVDGRICYYVCADGVVTEYACDTRGRKLTADGTVVGYATAYARGEECFEYARGEVRRVDYGNVSDQSPSQ